MLKLRNYEFLLDAYLNASICVCIDIKVFCNVNIVFSSVISRCIKSDSIFYVIHNIKIKHWHFLLLISSSFYKKTNK